MLCYIYFNAFKAKNDVIFHYNYININVKNANNLEHYWKIYIKCKKCQYLEQNEIH